MTALTLLDLLARRRVTVVTGAPGSGQFHIAEEIAFRAARAGQSVAVLVDGPPHIQAQVLDRCAAWRSYRNVPIGQHMRLSAINVQKLRVNEILRELRGTDVLVDPRLAQQINGFHSHEAPPVWETVRALAKDGGAVLLAGHRGAARSDEGLTGADEVWQCEAGRELAITLTGPHGLELIKLRGRDVIAPGAKMLIFDEKLESVS